MKPAPRLALALLEGASNRPPGWRVQSARLHHGLVALVSCAALLFMCVPILVVLPMSFSAGESLEFPPTEYSLRWYEAFLNDPRWLGALRTSLVVAFIASMGALVLGSLAAYGLVMVWSEAAFGGDAC